MGRVALRIRAGKLPGRRFGEETGWHGTAARSWKALGRPAHLPLTVPLDLRAG